MVLVHGFVHTGDKGYTVARCYPALAGARAELPGESVVPLCLHTFLEKADFLFSIAPRRPQ